MACVEVVAFVDSSGDFICVCSWQVGCVGNGLMDLLVVGGKCGDGFGVRLHQGEMHRLILAWRSSMLWQSVKSKG